MKSWIKPTSTLRLTDLFNRLKNVKKRLFFYSRLMEANTQLEQLVQARTTELEEANRQLKEKEEILIFQNEALKLKEELLTAHNEELAAQEEELTDYISRLSEQQERERLVRWIVMSIRESLELEQVICRTTQEVGYLLKVDRCFVARYNPKQKMFHVLQSVYRSSDSIPATHDIDMLGNRCPEIQERIVQQLEPVIIHQVQDYLPLAPFQDHCHKLGIQSAVIIPLVNQTELLGALSVHQVNGAREWSDKEIETLKDIAQQVSIAVYQASLYREVQEATRLKSEFLANMSHEFRTPLNAIIGFSEMILSEHYGPLTQKQRDYTQNVIKSGHHLLTLVNDILDLSKVESGNMELHYELFNLPRTILETTNIVKGLAYKKKIEIQLQIDSALNAAYADPARFKQILYNLLSNAVKFTPEHGHITVKAFYLPGDQKTLVMEVKDTGIGICETDREKVFREFQQIDASYARKQEGSGLGLALTRKLVEMHGGNIDFNSKLGQGSTFTVQLPCHISGELPSNLSPFRPLNSPPSQRQTNAPASTEALTITGNLLAISPFSESFQQLSTSLHIITATSVEEILRVFQQGPQVDVILLDLFCLGPEQRLGDTVFKIIKTDPELAEIPLIPVLIDPVNNNIGSIGAIDYLIAPLAEEILSKHVDKIRHNIIKEHRIRILGIGDDCLLTFLQHPTLERAKTHRQLLHLNITQVNERMFFTQRLPDLIVLETPYPLEPDRLAILEMLKSRIETKYIPIVLIGSFPGNASLKEQYNPVRMTTVAVKCESPLTLQIPTLTRLALSTNLAKDIEYALRIKKETA